MKVTARIFLLLAVFYAVVGTIYLFATSMEEPAGVTALYLSGGLCAMIAGYLLITDRKVEAGPDDDPEGEINEIEGEYGFFSPHSWTPLWLAAAGALMFLGVAVGWWLVILSFPLVAIATVLWTFEYFRGQDAI